MVATEDQSRQPVGRTVTDRRRTHVCVLDGLNRRCHKHSDLLVNQTVLRLSPNDMLSGCAGTKTWDECLASAYSSE